MPKFLFHYTCDESYRSWSVVSNAVYRSSAVDVPRLTPLVMLALPVRTSHSTNGSLSSRFSVTLSQFLDFNVLSAAEGNLRTTVIVKHITEHVIRQTVSDVSTRDTGFLLIPLLIVWPDTRIQGSLFAGYIKMYIGIFLGNVPFTRKEYITSTSLMLNNSNLNYEHVAQLTQVLTYPSTPKHS